MNTILLKWFTYAMAVFLVIFGCVHFSATAPLSAFFPDMVSPRTRLFLIYLSGAAEIILGIGLLIAKFRRIAALLTICMLVAYLPLHIRDLFLDRPAIGSKKVAVFRVFAQGALIYLMWLASKRAEKKKDEANRQMPGNKAEDSYGRS